MSKKGLIFYCVAWSIIPFTMGTMINLLIVPLAGRLPILNIVSICICALISIGSGVLMYNSDKKFIDEN